MGRLRKAGRAGERRQTEREAGNWTINKGEKIRGIIVIGKITRLLIVRVVPLGVRLALIP